MKFIKNKKFISILFSIFFLFVGITSCNVATVKSKAYKIGIDPTFYPLGLGKMEKNVFGFTNAILLEIADVLNIRLMVVKANWNNLFDGLYQKKYQAVFSSRYPYEFEKDKYIFSSPILYTGPALITKKENNKELDLTMMKGKLVGYVEGSGNLAILEKYEGIIPKKYLSMPDMLLDVENGFLNGGLGAYQVAGTYVKNLYKEKLQIAKPLNDEGIRLIARKGNEEIIKIFEKGLDHIKENNRFGREQQKWKLL